MHSDSTPWFIAATTATNAMRKFQSHSFNGETPGIAIDFDKDPVAKRNREYEKEVRKS